VSSSPAQTMADFEFDNSATVQASSSPPGVGDTNKYSFSNYKNSLNGKVTSGGAQVSLLTGLMVDPPLNLNDAINEYRMTGGGPTSGFLGINAYSLQNRLVKAFMGLLLVLFVGAAVIQGLSRVASGQGDLNYVQLAMKLMIGLIVVFFPHFLYGVVRVVQTGGVHIASAALSSVSSSAYVNNVNNASFMAQDADQLYIDAVLQTNGILSPYYKFGNLSEITDAANQWNTFVTQATPNLQPVIVPADSAEASQAAAHMQGQFNQIVGKNTALRSTFDTKKTAYLADIKATPSNVEALRDQFLKDLMADVKAKAEEIYIVEPNTPGILAGIGQKIWGWFTGAAQNVSGFIAGIFIPIICWLLIRISCLILELTLVVTVLTFPLWFLESTKKAFVGTFNTLLMSAIMPTVGTILLLIFEGICATLYTAVAGASILFLGMTLVFQLVYAIFWLVGCIVILWKTPSIAKAILEGGSFVGQTLGGLMTAGIAAGLAGVGIAATAASFAMPAAAPALQAANKGVQGLGSAVKEGASEASSGSGSDSADSPGGSMGARLPKASGTAAEAVNRNASTAGGKQRFGTEDKLSAKNAKEAEMDNWVQSMQGLPPSESTDEKGTGASAVKTGSKSGTGNVAGARNATGKPSVRGSRALNFAQGATRAASAGGAAGSRGMSQVDDAGTGGFFEGGGSMSNGGGYAGDPAGHNDGGEGSSSEGAHQGGGMSGSALTGSAKPAGWGRGSIRAIPKMSMKAPGRRLATHAHNAVVVARGLGQKGSQGRQLLGGVAKVAGQAVGAAVLSGGDPGTYAKVVGGMQVAKMIGARDRTNQSKKPTSIL